MSDHRLAVIGAGTMGTGLATLAVGHGLPVVLVDHDAGTRDRAEGVVRQNLRMAQMLGKLPAEAGGPDLLVLAPDPEAAADADMVVECVVERADVKAQVLAEVSAAVAPGTPLLTNTSAIPVDELADAAVRPEDVVGAHFMNPPHLIEGVEVVRGPRTSKEALDRAHTWLTDLGRAPVVVGDGPGFVINRVLQRMINEAATVVQEGLATPEAVDALFTSCLGHRTGPLATGDLIGLDNVVDTLHVLHERTGSDGYRPCRLLLEKVEQGQLGRKTGAGFHEYGTGIA
ncbi:3-hydroxyacyl-CoA dehydrogenase family protein [Streptomyces sp. NPDC005438]|uniref:3-hydroxyacyl-CoA dehydrogenase family protein n=1 Tax=Streptomyces sp. NPDC005438 TaxID=3156880 RepID=UPI0033BDC4A3